MLNAVKLVPRRGRVCQNIEPAQSGGILAFSHVMRGGWVGGCLGGDVSSSSVVCLPGALADLTQQITDLVTSLQSTETQISQVSSGALMEANRVLDQVRRIEATVQLALTTATNTVTVSEHGYLHRHGQPSGSVRLSTFRQGYHTQHSARSAFRTTSNVCQFTSTLDALLT